MSLYLLIALAGITCRHSEAELCVLVIALTTLRRSVKWFGSNSNIFLWRANDIIDCWWLTSQQNRAKLKLAPFVLTSTSTVPFPPTTLIELDSKQ